MQSRAQKIRNQIAGKRRMNPATDVSDLRRALTAVVLEGHIRKALAADPPLTWEQREDLAELLAPAGGEQK